jgi:hypothetical protein
MEAKIQSHKPSAITALIIVLSTATIGYYYIINNMYILFPIYITFCLFACFSVRNQELYEKSTLIINLILLIGIILSV